MGQPSSDIVLHLVSAREALRSDGRWTGVAESWCYVGTDMARRARVARRLEAARRVSIGDDITRKALAIKPLFLEWVAQIGRSQQRPLHWWAMRLASPDPQETDLLALLSAAELLREWVESGGQRPAMVVVIEDPWLLATLARWFAEDSRVAVHSASRAACLADAMRWLIRAPRRFAATGLLALRAAWTARRLFRAADEQQPSARDAVLLYTWIQPQCFAAAGRPVDRWTGRLEQVLSGAGMAVRRVSPVAVPEALMRRLKEFSSPFIVTARYLSIGDLFQALAIWVRIDALSQLGWWQGRDVRLLLLREQWRERGEATAGAYRLEYFAMRRVARRWTGRTRCVIYPFENHPWDKLLCLAWREANPSVRLIGYQHSTVPPLLLTYALGQWQSETMPLPDLIVANGQQSLERLRDGGFPATRLVNGGSFRYESLHRLTPERRTGSAGLVPLEATVLVTLPLFRPHARQLVADLVEELQQPLRLSDGAPPARILMKSHPALPVREARRWVAGLPEWIQWTEAPLDRLWPSVNALLMTGATSSWWEAMLRGIPVVKYATDWLDPDGMEGAGMLRCSKATLRQAIIRALGSGPQAVPGTGFIEHVFGRVDDALWVAAAQGRPLETHRHAAHMALESA